MTATSGGLAFYVHHHGAGHAVRTRRIARHLDRRPLVLTSREDHGLDDVADVVMLPSDVPEQPCTTHVSPVLHWAPLDAETLGRRAERFVGALRRHGSTVLVSDVSIEALVLARLCGVAPVMVDHLGPRDDPPHELGRAVSVARLRPHPRVFEPESAATDHRTHHTGLLVETVDGIASARCRSRSDDLRRLVVLVGAGGTTFDVDSVADWVEALPGWRIDVHGPFAAAAGPRWRIHGWAERPSDAIDGADAILASAGAGTVADVVVGGTPLIVVAEARPFDEQHARAEAIDRLGLGLSTDRWPAPSSLAGLVDAASTMASTFHGPDRRELLEISDGRRTAAWLGDLVARCSSRLPIPRRGGGPGW